MKSNAFKLYKKLFKGICGQRITRSERMPLKPYGHPNPGHISRRKYQIHSRIAFFENKSFNY